jgi:hypothetical protein
LLLHVQFALYKIAQTMYLTCFIYEGFIMLKRHLLLASVLAGTFAITACSQETQDKTDAAAESAGEDAAANTEAAAAEAEVAAQEAGAEAAENAEVAGAAATDALANTGEAVVVGANEAVSATAGVVADGAAAVEDKASENAVEAEQQY